MHCEPWHEVEEVMIFTHWSLHPTDRWLVLRAGLVLTDLDVMVKRNISVLLLTASWSSRLQLLILSS